jgi:hypothetical protein
MSSSLLVSTVRAVMRLVQRTKCGLSYGGEECAEANGFTFARHRGCVFF